MTTPHPAKRVLVVDDERPILMTLEALLGRHGYRVELARTAAQGLELAEREEDAPNLILLDIGLPDLSGLEVLTRVKKSVPGVQVIVITAQDSLSNAIESIKLGAFHFISKPYAPEELLSLMKRALEQQDLASEAASLREETRALKAQLRKVEARSAPVFKNRRMVEIEDFIAQVAPSEANVLILGESGVGKEVIANLVHAKSRRAGGTMVKLNCAAFPAQMIEGELFGYLKGAFTGAVNDFPGLIAAAEGGTLFLDEIAEMPAVLQTRFLRVLQEREYRPLGSTKTLKADFRLVAATNQPIAQSVREGRLRADLYYRLNTFQVEVPPLRDRREDIGAMVLHFLARFARAEGRAEPPRMAPEALARLRDYPWPGNVRELENAIQYASVLARDGLITEAQLPREVLMPSEGREALLAAIVSSSVRSGGTSFAVDPTVAPGRNGAGLSPHPGGHPGGAGRDGSLNLEDRERQAIMQALAQTHGNKLKAAKILGIHRPTLYNKLKRLGIETKDKD